MLTFEDEFFTLKLTVFHNLNFQAYLDDLHEKFSFIANRQFFID